MPLTQITKHKSQITNQGFTLPEALGVGLILVVIIALSVYNFQMSQRRARDAQRKADLVSIGGALSQYISDFGSVPPAEGGKILACGTWTSVSSCRWGLDKLADLADPTYPVYLDRIPQDPKFRDGFTYVYFSNANQFQLLARLEDKNDVEVNYGILVRGVACGQVFCNYGIASGGTLLDRDLEATPSGELKQ